MNKNKSNNNKVFLPDYESNVISIISSILSYANVDTNELTNSIVDEALSKNPKNIIFFMFDGLGYYNILNCLNQDSFIRRNLRDKLSTVFPPTTTAATTSIHTCTYPEEHGWIGWSVFFKNEQREVELFLNRDKYTKEELDDKIYGKTYLGVKSVYEKLDDIGFENHTLYPDFITIKQTGKHTHGYEDMNGLFDKIIELSKGDNQKFISIYNPMPDYLMHEFGITSNEVKEEFENIDNFLLKLSNEIEDSIIIVTADHGLVDTQSKYINDYPEILSCLKREISVEPRFINFFIKDEKYSDFPSIFSKYFEDDFLLLTQKEFLDMKLLGPLGNFNFDSILLGDYIAISTGELMLQQYIESIDECHKFEACHAGITKEEMTVPLIIIDKKS